MRCYRCRYPYFVLWPHCPHSTAKRRHYYLIVSLLGVFVVSMGLLAALETL